MAWLNAAPRMPNQKSAPLSRLELTRRAGNEPDFPECDAIYLANYLWEIGPVSSGGMGPAPITHMEIRAWQENTGIDLSSWEARTLRDLSGAYLGQSSQSEDPSCPAPWSTVSLEDRRKMLPKLIKSALRG